MQAENNEIRRQDLRLMILGEKLGEGISRTTYRYALDPTKVIKIADNNVYQNVLEYDTWLYATPEMKKWLAPVRHLSPGGWFLIMDYVDDLPKPMAEKPMRLPKFLTDFSQSNFGLLKGKVVARDYGLTLPNHDTRLKKVFFYKD